MRLNIFAAIAAVALSCLPATAASAAVDSTPLTVTYTGNVTGFNSTYDTNYDVPVTFTGITTEADGADGTLNFTSFTTSDSSGVRTTNNAVGSFVGNLFRVTVGGITLADFNFVGGFPNFQTNTNYNVTLSGGAPIVGDFGSAAITGGAGVLRGSTSVAAVPEPATWAMMLLGFGAMGVSMRRRRNLVQIKQMA